MDEVQLNSEKQSNINVINFLWFKYFPYWPFYLLLLVIFSIGTWFYLQRTAPLYEATATLLIKDEKKGIDDSRMIESLNLLSTKKIVENELEVLGSRSLMEEVVNKLKLYAPVYRLGKWRPMLAYSSSPVKIEIQEPSSIIENPKIDFSVDIPRQTVLLQGSSFPLNQWVETKFGILKFNFANPNKQLVKEQLYFSLINPKRVVQGLMKQLEATSSSKLSTVIYLKLKNEEPTLAEDILNQLILAYNRAAVSDKNALAENTLSFVQERLDFVGRHLDTIEHKIESYKSKKGAVDISSQGKLFLENVSANDRKVGDINMQLAALEQVEKYVTSRDKTDGIVPSTLDDPNSLLSTLLKKLYEAELERAKIKKTTGENSSIMIAISDQIDKIKPSILENIQSQRKSLEASKMNLSSTNNSYSNMLQSIPQKERDLVEISRQQNIENNIYSFLLQKREEAALSNSSTIAENRLVDKAQASLLPVKPNKIIFYLMAIIFAFGTGFLIITVRELINRAIMYRSEIENLTNFPIIAEVIKTPSKNSTDVFDGASNIAAEQFRKLRATLNVQLQTNKSRKILITSNTNGEGKSFVIANLAYSLSIAGKKVIIIDANLTNPSLSKKFDLADKTGLSNYLLGENQPPEILNATKFNSNLFIIPAGLLPNNPSELILNGKIEDLFRYLENEFEYILIESGPVNLLSDAYILSSLCDLTMYIIRQGITSKIAIERLDKTNRINKLKNLAIVFNGVSTRGFSNYSYGDF